MRFRAFAWWRYQALLPKGEAWQCLIEALYDLKRGTKRIGEGLLGLLFFIFWPVIMLIRSAIWAHKAIRNKLLFAKLTPEQQSKKAELSMWKEWIVSE